MPWLGRRRENESRGPHGIWCPSEARRHIEDEEDPLSASSPIAPATRNRAEACSSNCHRLFARPTERCSHSWPSLAIHVQSKVAHMWRLGAVAMGATADRLSADDLVPRTQPGAAPSVPVAEPGIRPGQRSALSVRGTRCRGLRRSETTRRNHRLFPPRGARRPPSGPRRRLGQRLAHGCRSSAALSTVIAAVQGRSRRWRLSRSGGREEGEEAVSDDQVPWRRLVA